MATSLMLEKGSYENSAQMAWHSTYLDELPFSSNAKVMCTELLKIAK